jgi:hypothetical protein
MKEQVTISLPFSDIRRMCQEQITFTKKYCPWAKSISLRTSLNHELELFDLEWDEFPWPWFKGFNYYNFFRDDELLPIYWIKAIRFAVKNNSPVV